MMTDSNAQVSTQATTGQVFQEAYERHLAAIKALDADELQIINVDISAAVATTLGIVPKLVALREDAATLPRFSISFFDELGGYARALAYAHSVYQAATAPPANLPQLNAEAVQLRQILMADAQALATRGLIDGQQLANFKGLTGYKHVAFDLLGLATVLRGAWDRIAAKTALELSELAKAEQLSNTLLVAAGEKEQIASAEVTEASLRRQQAYTLFINAYDQVRRAVLFLRWEEDDAEEIAPSLYAKQANHGRTKHEPDPAPAPVTAPAAAPAPGAAPAAPAGMPGSSPFIKLGSGPHGRALSRIRAAAGWRRPGDTLPATASPPGHPRRHRRHDRQRQDGAAHGRL
jgi:hypothetical protein